MKTLIKLVACFLMLSFSCTPALKFPDIKNSVEEKNAISAQNKNVLVKSEAAQPMALIKGQKYIPLYGSDSTEIVVSDFLMDIYPVTNEHYLLFVKMNPQWRRSEVKKIFADGNYLRGWQNDTVLGKEQLAKAPVTTISWYAANAYCECQGKRLPTIDEWEYAAMADESNPDARQSESYTKFILTWYEKRNTFNNEVGHTYENYWGVADMHGLVWEWTSDFNSVMVADDSRKGTGDDNLFCGGATVGASDLRNYAAFMRYAFRGSLEANYSVQNLGFRCVKDIQ